MKKTMKVFLSLILMLVLMINLTSCDKGGNTATDDQIKVIYNLAVESGYEGTYEEWLESIKGDYIEISVTATHIIWKYKSETMWKNLIELSKLSGLQGENGKDGLTPEFRVNEGYLEWKYTTDTEWIQLYKVITNKTITVTYVIDWEFKEGTLDEIIINKSIQREVSAGNLEEPTDILSDDEVCYGWYFYDKYFGLTPWYFDAYSTSKDITLYASVEIGYNVTYLDENDKVYKVVPVIENMYTHAIDYTPMINGYSFIGWTENGRDLFDFNQPINCNVTLRPLLNSSSNTVNVYLNYIGQNGVSYQEYDSYYNIVDKTIYSRGDLLPSWKALASILDLNIKDVASYAENKDNDIFIAAKSNNYVGKDGSYIDLFYNSTNNINKMGITGEAVDLIPYLEEGKMPYFEQFLSENPEVLDMCVVYDEQGNKHLYYTPYFDGYQQIERMFIMDTEMVERLLDDIDAGDLTAAIGEKRLNGAYYQPFMDAQYNYKDANTTVKVVKDNKAVDLKVVQTTNIIKQQNDLLANSSTTGKQLVAQLQAYLKTAYPDYAGKLSEIYTGVNAIYNADDLIALMRVVRANPVTATNQAKASDTGVEILFPRGQAPNRMENILDFAEIWGLGGLDSESNNLYFDGAGKLNVVGGMQASYDALVLLNQIYNEGLILADFYERSTGGSTYHLDRYFKNTAIDSGAGFLMYDYCASTTVSNDTDSKGIGTSVSSRKGVYEGVSRKGIRPVLAPVTYWNTNYEETDTNTLFGIDGVCTNRDKKELTRYSDSNRALKANSWCIPSNSTNIECALKLMDYMYSEEGANINNFGPQEYRGEMSSDIIYGQEVPTLSASLINMYLASGTDFWTFMRKYIGSTNGIGHVRSDALDMQVTNEYGQIGLKNVQTAISLGVMTLAKCNTPDNYGFGVSVPTNWQVSENVMYEDLYSNVSNFWNQTKYGIVGWKAVVICAPGTDLSTIKVYDDVTYSQVLEQRTTFNKLYLSIWSESINCTPSWLKELL